MNVWLPTGQKVKNAKNPFKNHPLDTATVTTCLNPDKNARNDDDDDDEDNDDDDDNEDDDDAPRTTEALESVCQQH